MRNLTLKQFGIILIAIMIISLILILFSLYNIKKTALISIDRSDLVNKVSNSFLEAVASYRAYQITHDEMEISKFKEITSGMKRDFERLLETTRTETNRKLIKQVSENFNKWVDNQLGRRLELIRKEKASGLNDIERRELAELTDYSRRFSADIKRDLETISKNIHENSERFITHSLIQIMIAIVISGSLIFIGFLILLNNVSNGIRTVQEVLSNMAEGRFDITIKTDLTNEVGKMLNSLITTQEAVKVLFDKMLTARKKTETNIGLVKDTSDTLSQTADSGKMLAKQIEEAVEQTASSIGYVASAMEEMVATITEISKNTMNAKQAADHASAESENAMAVVESLNQSAQRVSEVSKLIGNIASQTNLLALNATIEAARAGEAGKGFAVVANEVKELAKQTAQSVQEIEAIIQDIQRGTQDTLNVMRSINEAISRVADINNQIASAVEEQTATANEISKRLQESNQKANEVANSSSEITTLSEQLAERAAYLAKVTRDLSDANEELRQAMSVFKTLQ